MTLSALFAEWPRDRLAQIHSDDRAPDPSSAGLFFRLNEGERLVGPMPVRQAIRSLRLAFGRGETSTLFFPRITRRLDRWLERFRPEVVFTQLGGLPMGRLSLAIARRYRAPLVVHVSDDWVPGWPSNVLGRSVFPLTHLANRAMRAVLQRAFAEAAAVTVISEDMAEEYERRYGRRGRVLGNGIELTAWPERVAPAPGDPPRIVYSGSVFPYGQFASLEDVRDAIAGLQRDGRDVRLVLRTQHSGSPPHRAAFGTSPGVELEGLVARPDLPRSLQTADALLLPVNFDPVTGDFLRLSMPGKLAEYLASGTPVLYYGPANMAQARFLAQNGCAELVTTRDPARLRTGILRVLEDGDFRRSLSVAGRRAAERFFDIRALRATLYGVLSDALSDTVAAV